MQLHGVEIEDTFAEAFPMVATRVIITACDLTWAHTAANLATGYACSVIACDAEAGVTQELPPDGTPDHRPGVACLFFAFNRDALQKAVVKRIGQTVLTCPTTAVYCDLFGEPGKTIKVGGNLRYFGDGWQISKLLDGQRYWRIPTMDGEFLCQDEFATVRGVAGGNLILFGTTQETTLNAAKTAVAAMRCVQDVILPFPGGVVRSGSKVGSRYKALRASTNEAYCPTLRGVVPSRIPSNANCCYEIVVDGLTQTAVEESMRRGILAASACSGVVKISAGNYGGNLGPYHLKLHALLGEVPTC
jgi:formylmethanofuran--tetrahydromethanopterin N-formyltransferase